jgi:uncharacterized membrane protein YgcG
MKQWFDLADLTYVDHCSLRRTNVSVHSLHRLTIGDSTMKLLHVFMLFAAPFFALADLSDVGIVEAAAVESIPLEVLPESGIETGNRQLGTGGKGGGKGGKGGKGGGKGGSGKGGKGGGKGKPFLLRY